MANVPRQRGFTLVELLVVMAIISILISIVAPTLGSARRSAERTGCAANLREVGLALRSYLDNNEEKLPWASWMPSVGPFPVGGGGGSPWDPIPIGTRPIYIADVLQKDTAGQSQIFKCLGDRGDIDRDPPNGYCKSYFQTERSSYEFRWRLGGQTMKEYVEDMQEHHGVVPQNSVWVFRDFNDFHGTTRRTARRYLYIDGHVTNWESY